MPTECNPMLFEFAPVEGRRVVAGFDGGAITTDAGALLLGETDRAIRLTDRFAAGFTDARVAELAGTALILTWVLRAAGRQLNAEPNGAEPPGADALSQGESRSGGDRGIVRRCVP